MESTEKSGPFRLVAIRGGALYRTIYRRLREGIARKLDLSDSRRLFVYNGGSSFTNNYKKGVFNSFSGERIRLDAYPRFLLGYVDLYYIKSRIQANSSGMGLIKT